MQRFSQKLIERTAWRHASRVFAENEDGAVAAEAEKPGTAVRTMAGCAG
jgi:hypothetical protein